MVDPPAYLRRSVLSRRTSWVRRRQLERRHARLRATGLVPELRLTSPGEPDRGPLPTWIRLLPLAPALLVAGVLLALRRRRS
ncbi:hypothetical protein [Actinocatenispora comari]|uniref:Uncharacterized protein n=1 Tax=Actinocatenispora comari TaxID=2807577 RepID=A0A8J4A9M4_9ACTN|nr:hypothetical protein [Actinocatenispora comari]GIL27404.1 hypothetical protein NUM_26580 [Actinocatenispora comari]